MPSIDADARLFTPSVPLPDSEDAVRSPAPGFGVAWRSAPVRHLGVARPEGAGSLPEWCAFGELDERWQAALTR